MDDYQVGYSKPPKHSQFKPGQSGNPNGKPKGAKGLRAELRAELNRLVPIVENGKTRKLPMRRVVIKALINKAAKADVRAADRLLNLIIKLEEFDDPRPERRRLSEADQQIIEQLLGDQENRIESRSADPAGSDRQAPEHDKEQGRDEP